GAQFELGTHRCGLLHLLQAHVDDLELGVGDHHTVDTHVTAGRDHGERLARREMSRVNHQFLFGADFSYLAHSWQTLAIGFEHLDAFRRILEMLDVVVGVEGGEPHHAAVSALHPPHP